MRSNQCSSVENRCRDGDKLYVRHGEETVEDRKGCTVPQPNWLDPAFEANQITYCDLMVMGVEKGAS